MSEKKRILIQLDSDPHASVFDRVVAVDAGVEHVPLPDILVTNVCFGGPDLSTAFVTLSGTGKLVALKWPRPGLPLAF